MGKRIHVISKRAEYGNTEAFNWQQEEFRDLLGSLGCNTCGEDYSDNYECEKREYERGIEILKLYKDKGMDADLSDLPTFDGDYAEALNDVIDFDYVQECLNDLGDDTEDIIKVMEAFLKEADPNSGWISFSAW